MEEILKDIEKRQQQANNSYDVMLKSISIFPKEKQDKIIEYFNFCANSKQMPDLNIISKLCQ